MSYKDILVHLDTSPRSDVRLRIATELAERHEAHLAGLYVMDLPPPTMFVGDTSIADDIIGRARDVAAETGRKVRERFEETLRRSGIEGEWRCVEALAAQTLAVHARYADLAIVGQENKNPGVPMGESHIPETVILESGRPVLVVPYTGDVKPIGHTVLIGWKSSREAAHAVNDAMPFLAHAKSTTVLAIDADDRVSGEGLLPASDIAQHLARHGVQVTVTQTVSGGIGVGNVLLNYASDLGADLIVVGGYGHSRAREFVLGGATRSLLATMTVPVLFSH